MRRIVRRILVIIFIGASLLSVQAQNTSSSTSASAGQSVSTVSIVQQAPERAETIMKALSAAYPDILGPAQYIKGDWAIAVRGVLYFYAGGRLLPAELLSQAEQYAPQPFYTYPAEMPVWKTPSAEESERMKIATRRRTSQPLKRSSRFWDAVYRASSKEEAYERLKTLRFLGRNVMVHYSILEELSLVEEQILAAAKKDTQVQKWINSIDTLSAWNWRTIAQSETRSYHAYATALDILPKHSGNLETYWLWTAEDNPEWWTVPYEKRLHPPDAVVKAFERYGFIWGGKWSFYDTMHFEYRPELLLLSGIQTAQFH
ncbi:MAG: M15 family metallopeptidase [Spirochaetaceae bacterium]|nr:M15 family metallopeptidase [Spirochaetaceae bacterium]